MSYGSRKRGYDQGGFDLPSSPAYNVEPVTNTSSSSCANNGRRTPRWVLDARRRSSRLCFSHFATRTVDNTVDLYADIRLESRFWLPHLHSTPLLGGGVPVGISPTRLVWSYPMVKKLWRYVYLFWHEPRTSQTDRHRMTARAAICIASRGKN